MKKLHAFATAGQSNNEGYGNASLAPVVGNYATYYAQGNPHLMDGIVAHTGGSGSAWNAFAVEYHRITGNDIVFVPVARGGSSLFADVAVGDRAPYGTWDVSAQGNHTQSAIATMQDAERVYAGYGYELDWQSVLWNEGESEQPAMLSGQHTMQDIVLGLSQVHAAFSSMFHGIDFGVGAVSYSGYYGSSGFTTGTNNVRDAQYMFTDQTNADMLFSNAYTFPHTAYMSSDYLHYSQEGLNLMGTMMAYSYVHQHDQGIGEDAGITRDDAGLTYFDGNYLGGPSFDWRIIGIADTNCDGINDIIWRHEDGSIGEWHIDSDSIIDARYIGGPSNDWLTVGMQDRTHDGVDDIIFHNQATGELAYWDISHNTLQGATIAVLPLDARILSVDECITVSLWNSEFTL